MDKDHMSELEPTASITEQANHWCILLNGGSATRADKIAFGDWVSRSPERVEAYIQAARLTKALRSKKVRWPDTPVDDLVREAKETPAEVVSIFSPPSSQAKPKDRQGHRKPPHMLAFAATVLVAIAGTWVFLASSQRYTTAIGEQRSVVLSDGSVVTLNTSSSIRVKLTKATRTIQLLSGEALFQVAHDKGRPFDVVAGDTTVRAVGTQFNVDRRASSTTVTVVEGLVQVSTDPQANAPQSMERVSKAGEESDSPRTGSGSIPVAAGEGVTVSPRVHPRATPANVATVTAWTQRRLIFEHRPLGEVADEFNRYNRQAIRIGSAELRNQEVTGVFQANDPNSFLDFVAKIPGVKIERDADAANVVSSN
jgi:transmembrane sensor